MINFILPLSLAVSAFAASPGVSAPTVSGIIGVVYPNATVTGVFISALEQGSGAIQLTTVTSDALRVTIPAGKCSTAGTSEIIDLSTTSLGQPYLGACLMSGSADLSLADSSFVTATGTGPSGAADIDKCSGKSHVWSRDCAAQSLALTWLTSTGLSVPTQTYVRLATTTLFISPPAEALRPGYDQLQDVRPAFTGTVGFTGNYTSYVAANPADPAGDRVTYTIQQATLVFIPYPI